MALPRRPLVRAVALALALAPVLPARPRAQGAPGPATALVEDFHATLLGVMREAAALGVRGRAARIGPAMRAAFDLPAMARIAVGPAWTGFAPDRQAALAEAFAAWSVATYASRFEGFSGERFVTEGEAAVRSGADRMVRTRIERPAGEPVVLGYLVRGAPDRPRIVDVYLTGSISELASRRAEFAGLVAAGGPERLTDELRSRAAALLGG